MTILRSLSPWIAYALLSSFVADRFAALVAALLAAGLVGIAVRAGRRADELVLELSSFVFFAGYDTLAWVVGGAQLPQWVGPASQWWLAATVLVTLLLRRPFTLALAKREAPPQVWDTPWFYDFNVTLTRAWLISFFVSALVLTIAAASGLSSLWLSVACIALSITVPVIYTKRVIATHMP